MWMLFDCDFSWLVCLHFRMYLCSLFAAYRGVDVREFFFQSVYYMLIFKR